MFLATFTFVVPLTSPWWSTVLRREISDVPEEDGNGPIEASNAGLDAAVSSGAGPSLRITLHPQLQDTLRLATVEREIPYVRGILPQIQAAVSELAITTPEVPALLPEGTRVLDVAFTRDGTAYLDFSLELDQARGLGPDEENLLVQGIVATVTANFRAVRRVIILVDGKAPRLFHLDLTRPVTPDANLLTVFDPAAPPTGAEVDSGPVAPAASSATKPPPPATPLPGN